MFQKPMPATSTSRRTIGPCRLPDPESQHDGQEQQPDRALEDERQAGDPAPRRIVRLRVSDHPSLVTFGKAAYVDIGPVHTLEDGGWEVEVGWRASSLAPLFPVFSGTIVARGEDLTLSGWYAPPGGTLGRMADRALLHIAAEGTARWLLRELDEAAAQGAA
jgi:hypothetical protein